MSEEKEHNSPNEVLSRDDPGDDTQLRFRYQHGYGVILLARAASIKDYYTSIWCEHHDDILAEKPSGQFDSFQIKTRHSGLACWQLNHDDVSSSIKKFVKQDLRFPGCIDNFHFVTNHCFKDTSSQKELVKSPIQMKRAIESAHSYEDLADPFASTLADSAGKFGCDIHILFHVWQRLRLVKGPSLADFNDVIAHTHLANIQACSSMSPAELNSFRDELIHLVFAASSLQIDDPTKHWSCVAGEDDRNPRLKAKRIAVEAVSRMLEDHKRPTFQFAPTDRALVLSPHRTLSCLEQKAIHGGLADQLPTLRRRTISAEQHLLKLANRNEKNIDAILDQLHGVVKSVCDDARLEASAGDSPYGEQMLRIVTRRLRELAESKPDTVYGQEYDCLVGLAGLLTEECEVWWSSEFDLEKTA